MENIFYNISQVLGIAIVHSLWQGLLIYFVLRIIFTASPGLSAVKKYNLALAAIVSMLVCFVYTLTNEFNAWNWVNAKPVSPIALLPYLTLPVNPSTLISRQSFYQTISGYLPYISAIYITGLVVNLLKFGLQWHKIRQIKLSLIPAEQMQQYINKFSKKLDLDKLILVKFSDLIDVPCITGYFKPMILLPVSIATNLTACEIESILLHELSHIKRNDYLVNLLQRVINLVLFFNPFAQLINRIINQERENGCDDLVVEKTRRPLIYAQALLKLEENRKTRLQFALAARGSKYQLLNRIERIMKTKQPIGQTRHLLIAILLLTGSLGSLAWFNPKTAEAKTTVKSAKTTAKTTMTTVATVSNTPALKLTARLTGINDTNKTVTIPDTTKHDSVKHEHVNRVIIIDKDGDRKTFSSADSTGMDSAAHFFAGPKWAAQVEALRKQGEEMRKQFNNPQWKAQMEAMRKQSAAMMKQFNSAQWKAQTEAMRRQSEQIRKQFNSPQWKAQEKAIRKQAEEMQKQFNSQQWRTQLDAIKRQSEEMRKQFDNPQWRAQVDAMRKQGEEMRKQFRSPEWRAQMDEIRKQSEEMRKQFNSDEWRNQMDVVRKQNGEMRKLRENMRKAFDKPEWRKRMKYKRGDNDTTDIASPEPPEKPEAPEEPESPENN